MSQSHTADQRAERLARNAELVASVTASIEGQNWTDLPLTDDEKNVIAMAVCATVTALERQPIAPLTKRISDFIGERDPFGDHFSQHDLQLIATLAPQPEDERLRKIIRQAVEAYDSGNLQLSSPEIGEPESDIPMHPWHEEWLHYARAALIADIRPGEKS